MIFSSSTPGNFSREECNSKCFSEEKRYGGLGARRECLCSRNSEPNLLSEAQCSAACTDQHVMKECGWTLAYDAFAVHFSVSLKPLPPVSVHAAAHVSASSSVVPVTLSWDLGDLSPRVNATETSVTAVTHKYGVPGRYVVELTAWAGQKEVRVKGEVTVTLPPKLELRCPALVEANQNLSVTLVNWGGTGVAVDWRITREGQETTRASPLCPPGGVSHQASSRCFQLVPGEFSWAESRRRCLERGGELAVVHTQAVRSLLALRITQI